MCTSKKTKPVFYIIPLATDVKKFTPTPTPIPPATTSLENLLLLNIIKSCQPSTLMIYRMSFPNSFQNHARVSLLFAFLSQLMYISSLLKELFNVCVHTTACGWESTCQDNLHESVGFLSILWVPRAQTQVGRLGGKCPYPLSPITSLFFIS